MLSGCIAVGGVAAIISLSSSAGVMTITTDDGVGADAVVVSSSADSNYGAGLNMRIGVTSASRLGYVRFDLSSVTEPVSEATLSFAVYANAGENNDGGLLQLFVLNDGDAGEGWSETGITWNNAPANAGTGITMSDNATLVALEAFDVRTAAPGSIVSYSGASLVDAISNDTNGQITFILAGQAAYTGTTHPVLSTREHPNHAPPTLTLTLAPIPEPASLMVLGAGVPALMMRRRSAR